MTILQITLLIQSCVYAVCDCNLKINYDTLIDLGCGNGHFINLALDYKKNLKIVGIDLSSDSVQTCKTNIKKNEY